MATAHHLRMSAIAGAMSRIGDINEPPLRDALDYIRELGEALDGLLSVQPRPVKLPGTAMDLTVSYTESDLLKMKEARLIVTAARGVGEVDDAAPRNDD